MEKEKKFSFYPLQVKSYYSFYESAMKPNEYALALKQNHFPGGAITDLNSINGFPKYSSVFNEHNLRLISGIEINIIDDKDNVFQLLLYIQNEEGYKSVISLLDSEKNLFNINDLEKLVGLAAIIKTSNSYFYTDLDNGINSFLLKLYSIFPLFYLGIEIYSEEEMELIKSIRDFASSHNLKTIAIPEVKYVSKKYFHRYCMLQAIKQKAKVNDLEESLPKCYFLLSEAALSKLYTEEEINATEVIASSCDFNIFTKRGEIYHVYPSKEESDDNLKTLVLEKLEEKKLNKVYEDRALYELSIISKMGFSDYFLIVSDYVNYAKTHDIKVGPGRGSAASSLVSFLLNITEIDPIKHELIFERFLNPDRVSMPDIDIDFEDTKRDEIINYLKSKYDSSRVMQIITYSTFKASSALNAMLEIRSDCRVEFIKHLSSSLKPNTSLEENKKTNDRTKKIIQDEFYNGLLEDAMLIEGFPNNTSKHASGVILSDEHLNKLVPTKDEIIEFEFPDLEKMGFLKLDILGLTNLSLIRQIEDKILSHNKVLPIIDDNHTDDTKVYETLNKTNTIGIFQLESYGMKDAIKQIKPNCFNDLVALIALYRPGPMDNIPLYAKNKENPNNVVHYSKEVDKILSSTNNIIIYQEQIMAIVKEYASLSNGIADSFRRAISKKDIDKMNKYKAMFFEGAKNNGKDEKEINKIYSLIEKFASYGFNKAHSVSYSLISYKLLAYKTYFPIEFYDVLIKNGSFNSKTAYHFKKELESLSYLMKGPLLHHSKKELVLENNIVYFPLSTIKGLTEETIEVLSSLPNKFESLLKIFQYLLDKNVPEKDLKKLIDAGAFDEYEDNRELLRFNFDSLSTCNYLEQSNSISLINKEKDLVEDYIREYTALGYVFSKSISDISKINYTRDTYIILHALNFNATEYEALNDYGILTLSFASSTPLKNNTIITVEGRTVKNRKYVDKYKEVKI